MNLLRFAGAIVYHFFAAMHVLRARTRARGAAVLGIAAGGGGMTASAGAVDIFTEK